MSYIPQNLKKWFTYCIIFKRKYRLSANRILIQANDVIKNLFRSGKIRTETFDNVWNAVSDIPEQAENMRIRVEFTTIINDWIEQQGFSQAQAASALGVTQPRVSELARSRVQIFSIDKLITIAAHMGLHIQRIET